MALSPEQFEQFKKLLIMKKQQPQAPEKTEVYGPVVPSSQPTAKDRGEAMYQSYANPQESKAQADEFWKSKLPSPVFTAAKTFKDYVAEPVSLGVAKGVGGIGETVVNLADTVAEKFGGDIVGKEAQAKMAEFTKPETTGQAVIKAATQGIIGGGVGAKIGAKIASPLVNYLGTGSKTAQTAGNILGFGSKSLGATTGITGVSEGRLPTGKEATVGLLIDAITLGASKMLDPKRLKQKAMGISPDREKSLNKIVRSVKDTKGKPVYNDIQDFAIKNDITGNRDEMVERTKELFDKATESKPKVLASIKQKFPNNYEKLLDKIAVKYADFIDDSSYQRIDALKNKATLSAVELDEIRALADDVLPQGSYRGAEPAATADLQKAIDSIRKTLGEADSSGKLKMDNLFKRLLYADSSPTKSLSSALESASKKSVFGASAFRGATTGGTAYALSALPVIGPLAAKAGALVGGMEVLTSIPQVASLLGAINKGGRAGKVAQDQLAPILKSILQSAQQKPTNNQ